MPDETTTIENQQAMELAQSQLAQERLAEPSEESVKPAEERFINTGEAALLLAFFGIIAAISWLLNFIPYLGWVLNVIINFFAGFIFFIWLTGKVAKGAPKKWYKALYYGAAGSFFGGYFGAIIYLLIQDRKILGKVAGELGEKDTLSKLNSKQMRYGGGDQRDFRQQRLKALYELHGKERELELGRIRKQEAGELRGMALYDRGARREEKEQESIKKEAEKRAQRKYRPGWEPEALAKEEKERQKIEDEK